MADMNRETGEASEEAAPDQLFNQTERQLFRYTAVLLAIVALVGLLGVSMWLIARVLTFFYALLLPLAIAGVLALVLFPVVDFLERRGGLSRLGAVLVLFVTFLGFVLATAVYVLPTAIEQGRAFIEAGPAMADRWVANISRRFPRIVDIVSGMFDGGENGEPAVDVTAVRERVGTYIGVTVGFAFVPLYLFFALLAGDRIQTHLRDLLSVFGPEAEREIFYLITVFVNYITAFFRGQLVIALIMGVLYAIGFTIIGLKGAIFLGLFLGLLNIVPYLGAIVGLATALPIAYVQPDGGFALVGFALLVFAVVQTIESLLLTPKIMADRSGLHPAIVVISIFFWGSLIGGLVGMILAVPLSAFVATVWRHFRMRVRRTVVSDETEREIYEHEEREARRIIMPSDARAARRS